MKLCLEIEDGRISLTVDDGRPIELASTPSKAATAAPETPKPATVLPPARAKGVATRLEDERKCEVCSQPFQPKRANSWFCSPKCATKHYNAQARANAKAKTASTTGTASEPDVHYCRYCLAYTTHSSAEHRAKQAQEKAEPQFLLGHEKSADEVESWRPKPILPGEPGYASASRQ